MLIRLRIGYLGCSVSSSNCPSYEGLICPLNKKNVVIHVHLVFNSNENMKLRWIYFKIYLSYSFQQQYPNQIMFLNAT